MRNKTRFVVSLLLYTHKLLTIVTVESLKSKGNSVMKELGKSDIREIKWAWSVKNGRAGIKEEKSMVFRFSVQFQEIFQ